MEQCSAMLGTRIRMFIGRIGMPWRPEPGNNLSRAATNAIVFDRQPPRVKILPISLALEYIVGVGYLA